MTDDLDQDLSLTASRLNLLLPGGGLILCGELLAGLMIGLAFAVSANFALVALWIFPDDFADGWRALGLGILGGTYAGAQLRLRHELRLRRTAALADARRRALAEAQQHLAQGDAAGALAALNAVSALAEDDLLVAYRLAQALTAAGHITQARAAWRRVRRLDRHGLYRQQVEENERRLANPG